MTTPHIDIDHILRSRLGTRSRFLPRFLVGMLRRLAHEDQLNECLRLAGDKVGVEWLDVAVNYVGVRLEVSGLENLPPLCASGSLGAGQERYCFVSNHPLGGLDGITLGQLLGHHYQGHIKYIVNDLLMNLPGLAPLCIPVSKTGSQSRRLPELLRQAFDGPEHIIMFPAGLCSRRRGGQVQDLPWNKTFIQHSRRTGRDIVPIHFFGQNSKRFYRLASLSKRLGIKFNLAMLFLVDEMFRQSGSTFQVHIGRPIPASTFDHSRTPHEWAQWVREQVYAL